MRCHSVITAISRLLPNRFEIEPVGTTVLLLKKVIVTPPLITTAKGSSMLKTRKHVTKHVGATTELTPRACCVTHTFPRRPPDIKTNSFSQGGRPFAPHKTATRSLQMQSRSRARPPMAAYSNATHSPSGLRMESMVHCHKTTSALRFLAETRLFELHRRPVAQVGRTRLGGAAVASINRYSRRAPVSQLSMSIFE